LSSELNGLASSIETFCTKVRLVLEHATLVQRRQLVGLLIDRMVVTDNNVEIRYVIRPDRGIGSLIWVGADWAISVLFDCFTRFQWVLWRRFFPTSAQRPTLAIGRAIWT
jgi:hypothetical protein